MSGGQGQGQGQGQRRIDRVLDGAYLDGLTERPLADVRKMRAEVEEEEAMLSYERRLLQARIDIIKAEKERRSGGGGSLIERLPQILADEPSPSRGALALRNPPPLENPRRRVEKLVSDDTLLRIPDLTDEKLDEIITTLQSAEHDVSEQRKSVLTILDALTGEVGRRYASGEADPADVLAQGQ